TRGFANPPRGGDAFVGSSSSLSVSPSPLLAVTWAQTTGRSYDRPREQRRRRMQTCGRVQAGAPGPADRPRAIVFDPLVIQKLAKECRKPVRSTHAHRTPVDHVYA